MYRPPKPKLAGLEKGSPEHKAAIKRYQQHRNQYPPEEWKDPVRALNGTVPHESDAPVDDRPDYLDTDAPFTLAVDTETKGFDWFDGVRPFIATVSDHDRDYLYTFDGAHGYTDEQIAEDKAAFREALLLADRLIFHNAKFDVHHIVAAGIMTLDEILGREILDTETMARLTLPHTEVPDFKLKTLATLFVDADAKDYEHAVRECLVSLGLIQTPDQRAIEAEDAYYQVWLSYKKIMEDYAVQDTRITYDLAHVLLPRVKELGVEQVLDLETNLMPILARVEHAGTALDPEQVNMLKAKYDDEHAHNLARLRDFNDGVDVAPQNGTQIRALMENLGVQLTEKTPRGDIAVNKAALQRAIVNVPEAAPVVDAIFEARSTEKLLSTYINPMHNRDRVHMSYIQIGAWTGRMACMRPNMQNIPVRSGPEMRSMFVPDPGNHLIVADYSSIELRLLAYYMNDDNLWDIIENGDPFLWLGSQVYGTEDQEQWKVKRGPLKNGFYALTYGAGGPKLAQTIGGGMTDAEGRALAKKIKGVLGDRYRALNKLIEQKIIKDGYVTTLLGRRQFVKRDRTYVGLNSLIQGSAADIMKLAIVEAYKTIPTLLLTVHDELVAQVPAAEAPAKLEELKTIMASAQRLGKDGRLRLKVDGVVCENSYAEAK